VSRLSASSALGRAGDADQVAFGVGELTDNKGPGRSVGTHHACPAEPRPDTDGSSDRMDRGLRVGTLGDFMPLECINPPDLATPDTYTHVVVATGSRLVFVAGQVAEDSQGNLVGHGDLAVQARQAFENVGRALASAGARPDHVAKLTIFVVDYRHESLPAIEAGRTALFEDHKPVDALIGVQALAHPGCLIEVEAVAVVDDSRAALSP
jgi:enamine deaminase RidA (YjgF/YER057c/UK114 family)